MTPNKKELEVKLQDHALKIKNISTRKGELQKELTQITAAAEIRTQAIQSAMLEGRDFSKDLDAQRSDKAKAESLTGAITQAEGLLADYQSEHTSTEKKIGVIDYLSAAADVENHLLVCMKKVYEAIKTFEDIEPLIQNLQRVGSATGNAVESFDSTRQTDQIYRYMLTGLFGGDGIKQRMNMIETGYPNHLQEIRANK